MKFLRKIQDAQKPMFEKGGKLERLYPLFEANDTFLFTPEAVTKHASHVRDGIDLKRMMITVVVALLPCMFMAMYNTGLQAFLAMEQGALPLEVWQSTVWTDVFGLSFSGADGDPLSSNFWLCVLYGAMFYVPVYIVTLAAGGIAEATFSIIRRHEINEGFLVTSALFPLTLPATIPLWQVAMGILFGVIIGKEVFGGTGMNFLNPALTARAFLFFAYPAQISGDKVWIAANTAVSDGASGATWLARAAAPSNYFEGMTSGAAALAEGGGWELWWRSFIGTIPGSMGETSVLFCLIGAAILILTRVGSWRTMFGGVLGLLTMSMILNLFGAQFNPFFDVPFWWHMVIGSFAFAIVFMATDPVSSALTEKGKFLYGFLIGVMGIIIRVINPAYPEGWMLAILFMNMFAPLIDYFILQANVKRRMARYAT